MRRHQRVQGRQAGERRQHQVQPDHRFVAQPVAIVRHPRRRGGGDRQEQHHARLEEERQADQERDSHAHPGRRGRPAQAQRGAREGAGAVGQLQHRAERQPERDDEPGAAEHVAGALLHRLRGVGHRQSVKKADQEGAA